MLTENFRGVEPRSYVLFNLQLPCLAQRYPLVPYSLLTSSLADHASSHTVRLLMQLRSLILEYAISRLFTKVEHRLEQRPCLWHQLPITTDVTALFPHYS